MEIVGYIASLLIGVSLGLIGAGGSILTLPVMVYLFDVPVLQATSYSLFIVGITSLLGSCYQYKQNNIDGRAVLLLSLVSLVVVAITRNYVMPKVPLQFPVFGIMMPSSLISMVLFSILMIAAANAMIRRSDSAEAIQATGKVIPRLLLCGVGIGLVTGLLGAGGGFILIPSLVLLLGLPMQKAIGTSLLIIAMNSLGGFMLDVNHLPIEWKLLAYVTVIASCGIFLGIMISKKLHAD